MKGDYFVLSRLDEAAFRLSLICCKNAEIGSETVRVFLSLSCPVWALPYFSCAR